MELSQQNLVDQVALIILHATGEREKKKKILSLNIGSLCRSNQNEDYVCLLGNISVARMIKHWKSNINSCMTMIV